VQTLVLSNRHIASNFRHSVLFLLFIALSAGCSESTLEGVEKDPDDQSSETTPDTPSPPGDDGSGDNGNEPEPEPEPENIAPQADLVVTPVSGVLPLEIQLDASLSSDPEGQALVFRWDYDGDGTWDTDFESAAVVSHTVWTVGESTPRVEVKDPQELTDIALGQVVTVTEPELPSEELTANILVDANRDGVVTPADEAFEDGWSAQGGAIFPPNLDDDDNNGTRDGLEPGHDGEDDLLDMAPVLLSQVGGLNGSHRAVLELTGGTDVDGAGFIRIFREAPNGDISTLIEAGESSAEISVEWLAQGATKLYLEGILGRYIGFSGEVTLTLNLFDGDTLISSDVVELRGSPIILSHHMAAAERLFVLDIPYPGEADNNMALVSAFEEHLPDSVELYKIGGQTYGWDRWAQDSMQTGFTQWPGASGFESMKVHMQLERDGGLANFLPNELLDDVVGYVYPHGTGTSLNSGGNLEVIPAHRVGGQNFPYGRIVVGGGEAGSLYGYDNTRRMAQRQRDFFDSQVVQGPTFEVSSEWLAVGHIDEIFLVLPNRNATAGERPWVVLMASPSLAIEKLQEAQAAGAGQAPIFEGRASSGGWGNQDYETTTSDVLGDEDLMAYQDLAQARIDGVQQILMDEIGLTEEDFRYVPVLYEYENWSGVDEAIAYNPGIQNLVMADTVLFIPDPEGPNVNGEDIWQTSTLEALSGLGLEAHFVDVFFSYHTLMGEAHCGTNFEREAESLRWWNQE
jgi:protein-arginine deiminase